TCAAVAGMVSLRTAVSFVMYRLPVANCVTCRLNVISGTVCNDTYCAPFTGDSFITSGRSDPAPVPVQVNEKSSIAVDGRLPLPDDEGDKFTIRIHTVPV